MIQFQCDYSEGAHETILKKIMDTNMEQTVGYGGDPYTDQAKTLIRDLCGTPDADVHFLVGGTQTNLTVISAALRPYQGVVCAETGHIHVHETGAVESGGHKILTLKERDGKITAAQIEELYQAHISDENYEHTVQPGMVYLSQPTEMGTVYTKAELTDIYRICRNNSLYLFIDGARLGYGLMACDSDLTLQEMAHLCDVFYIGGTKMGALFGEAVVIHHPALKKDFRYLIKQKGGMLAKGRLLGIQFLALFEDGLYWRLGQEADRKAEQIQGAFREKGISFLAESHTNQIFPVLPDDLYERLRKKYQFAFQKRVDSGHCAVRICTSWATRQEHVDRLCEDIKESDCL